MVLRIFKMIATSGFLSASEYVRVWCVCYPLFAFYFLTTPILTT